MLTRGSLKTCKHCAKAKAKKKNVQKELVSDKAPVPGYWLYLDLSKVTVKSETLEDATIMITGRSLFVMSQERSGVISW